MAATHRSRPDDLTTRLQWLMLTRVLLVTFLFGVTVLVGLRHPETQLVSSFNHLYLLIGYAYLLTALSAVVFRRLRRTGPFIYGQIVGDILFITGILVLTGGLQSPFVFLYFLSIISGSTLLYQKGGFIAALLSSFSYLLFFYLQQGSAATAQTEPLTTAAQSHLYYRVFLNIFSFVIIAFLSNQLTGRLKRAGEAIREREDSIEDLQVLNENIVQSVTSGLITTDLAGRITSANISSEKILKITRGDMLQTTLHCLFPLPEVADYLSRVCTNISDDVFSRFEGERVTSIGEVMILGMTLSLLRNNRGNPVGVLCTFQDLTQIKTLEGEMRRREQLATVGELAAGIAHEIRNPLASMSGSIQVLASEVELNEDSRRLMEIILKETDRLNNLIGNFLMYARPRPLACKSVRLRDLLEESLTLLRNSDRLPGGVCIEAELDCDTELVVDAMAMRQVFWNLVINAIEAMPDGGRLKITCTRMPREHAPKADGGVVRISISDTGGGIDPCIREKLFFPFHTTKEGGSGLGLAIVHQIIKQHDGWVDVVSLPGEGSVFHLYLPENTPALVHEEV